jgi:CheY-like chemotaxis protein
MAQVLLVDDDADALDLRKLILESHGHEVHAALNVASAQEKFRPEQVVILDLRVPAVDDGLALIRAFRTASSGCRIVVLTGRREDLDRRPEAALVNAILEKPVRTEALLAAI